MGQQPEAKLYARLARLATIGFAIIGLLWSCQTAFVAIIAHSSGWLRAVGAMMFIIGAFFGVAAVGAEAARAKH